MSTGYVKWFSKRKGYGFAKCGEKDIFIHYTNLEEEIVLENNDFISFDIIDGEKGLIGKKIKKIKRK